MQPLFGLSSKKKRLSLSGSSFLSRSLSSSFLSSLCSLGLSLCGSSSGLLLSHLLGNSFIHFLLSLQFLGHGFLLCLGYSSFNSFETLLLVSFPGIELLLGSSLVEGTLLHTSAEMLHQVYTLTTQDVANCVCWLCTCLNPVKCTVEIQIYCGGIGVRVVGTNLFSKFTITWCASVGDNDAINCIALTATALQSDFCCHFVLKILN